MLTSCLNLKVTNKGIGFYGMAFRIDRIIIYYPFFLKLFFRFMTSNVAPLNA